MSLRLAIVPVTVAVAGTLVFGGPAAARPLDVSAVSGVQQVTVGTGSALVPLVADRLAPGTSVTARFEVHRGSGLTGGTYASEIGDVEDLENGCMHSEAADGDSSCGSSSGEGELSTQLIVEQQWSTPTSDCSAVAAPVRGGTMRAAAGSLVTAADSTADTACLTLVVDLPQQADNLVQSDSSRFALRIGLVGAAHEGDLVSSDEGTLGGGSLSGPGASLPLTGLDLPARLAVAGLALLTGTGLVLAGRRARTG